MSKRKKRIATLPESQWIWPEQDLSRTLGFTWPERPWADAVRRGDYRVSLTRGPTQIELDVPVLNGPLDEYWHFGADESDGLDGPEEDDRS